MGSWRGRHPGIHDTERGGVKTRDRATQCVRAELWPVRARAMGPVCDEVASAGGGTKAGRGWMFELRRVVHATVLYLGNAACIDMGKGMRMDVSRGTPSGTAPVSFSFSSHSLKSTQGSLQPHSPQPHGVTRHIAKTVSRPRWPCDRSCAWCARSRSAAAPFPFRQAFNSFARSSFGVLVSAPVPATGKEGIGGSCRRGRSDRGASP